MIRAAGVSGNATNYKTARATILYVQPEIKFRSYPGHCHHDPPLITLMQCLRHTFTQRWFSKSTKSKFATLPFYASSLQSFWLRSATSTVCISSSGPVKYPVTP